MHHLSKVLQSHPKPEGLDPEQIREAVMMLAECAFSCMACADACLSEASVEELRRCINRDRACAEICASLANILTQQSVPDKTLLKALTEACETACRSCASECEMHAEMHAHCAHCAKICRDCEAHCRALGEAL